MKKVVYFTVILLSFATVKAQSAWTLDEGAVYTQLSFTNIGPYDRLFLDGDKSITLPGEITDRTIQAFAEYGLSDKTTISLSLPFKSIEAETTNDLGEAMGSEQINALGNITLGVRQQLYNEDFVVSGSLLVETLTGSFDQASGVSTGLDAWSVIPSVSIGKGTNNFFAQANAGVALRTNDYSHGFHANGEAGYKLFDRAWIIGRLDYIASFENGDVVLPASQLNTLLYANDQEYAGYSLKAIVELTNQLGITAGTGGAFSANLLARKASLSFGLYYKFDTKKKQ